jgi:hypothetical protein
MLEMIKNLFTRAVFTHFRLKTRSEGDSKSYITILFPTKCYIQQGPNHLPHRYKRYTKSNAQRLSGMTNILNLLVQTITKTGKKEIEQCGMRMHAKEAIEEKKESKAIAKLVILVCIYTFSPAFSRGGVVSPVMLAYLLVSVLTAVSFSCSTAELPTRLGSSSTCSLTAALWPPTAFLLSFSFLVLGMRTSQ